MKKEKKLSKYELSDGDVIKAKNSRDQSYSLTFERCVVYHYDTHDSYRAKMSCGHAISVEGMTMHLRSLIDNGKYVINCADKNFCDAEWSYKVCREVGQLTQADMEMIEGRLSLTMALKEMGANECPKCKSLMMMDEENKSNRVECFICKKSG